MFCSRDIDLFNMVNMMETGIELKEFLRFLSTACKVNVADDSDEMKNLNDNLNELTSNLLIQRLFDERQSDLMRRNSDHQVNIENLNQIVDLLKRSLSELLTEGMFDSILTYVVPKKICADVSKSSSGTSNEPRSSNIFKKKRDKRKKTFETKKLSTRNEVEVEIQVHEEDKGLKRVFKCPQNLLVSNMPYFFDINKGRKLEEMDIMVHCEISTFEWLMRWVKRSSTDAASCDLPPKLDFKNVISIMSLASFLKMKPLFQDCIQFCKYNMNDVIKLTPNLSCLKDGVLRKLADVFDNVEVQNLKDENERIKSRLFSKLVRSLRDVEPDKRRGHFASLAHLYLCLNCNKLVTIATSPYIPCQVQNVVITSNGDAVFKHVRDSAWCIDDHIKKIWSQCKNWNETYWQLWSQSHFLYCGICCTMYPVAFSDCCPYHPEQPHFHTTEKFQAGTSPIGRYPCCGSKAIRYETVKIRSGCKLRSHIPKLLTSDDKKIQAIVDRFPNLIKVKATKDNVSSAENYDDIANLDILLKNATIDTEEKNGLLSGPLFEAHLKMIKKYKSVSWELKEDSRIQYLENGSMDLDIDSISAGESENSDMSSLEFSSALINDTEVTDIITENATEINPSQNELKPTWTSRYPNRFYNEDNQRDYEEIALQAVSEVLLQYGDKQKCSSKEVCRENSFPLGGSYAKIELEWKEARLKTLGVGNKCNKI